MITTKLQLSNSDGTDIHYRVSISLEAVLFLSFSTFPSFILSFLHPSVFVALDLLSPPPPSTKTPRQTNCHHLGHQTTSTNKRRTEPLHKTSQLSQSSPPPYPQPDHHFHNYYAPITIKPPSTSKTTTTGFVRYHTHHTHP